jgi:hypothetical protein
VPRSPSGCGISSSSNAYTSLYSNADEHFLVAFDRILPTEHIDVAYVLLFLLSSLPPRRRKNQRQQTSTTFACLRTVTFPVVASFFSYIHLYSPTHGSDDGEQQTYATKNVA